MRSYAFSFFLSFLIHGFILSISPRAELKTMVVRLDQIRLEKEGPVRLSALPSPNASLFAPPFSPGSALPPRQETKMPARRMVEKAEKKVAKITKHPEPPPLPPVASPEPQAQNLEKESAETEAQAARPAEEEGAPQVASIPFAEAGEGVGRVGGGEGPGGEEGGGAVEGSSSSAREGIWNAYLVRLREKVESARFYPDRARRMGQEGRVVVRFIVRAGGQIERVDLAEPSSFLLLNRAATETIRSLSSLSPLPPEFGDRIEVTIPFVYRLEQTARR